MCERNDGTGEDNILQNQFTAYLMVAIRNCKIRYLRSKAQIQKYEMMLELQDHIREIWSEPDMISGLSPMDQIENSRLWKGLKSTKSRDQYIFLAKTLDGRSLVEIAGELGISIHAASAAYYRMRQKLKKELDGDVT